MNKIEANAVELYYIDISDAVIGEFIKKNNGYKDKETVKAIVYL